MMIEYSLLLKRKLITKHHLNLIKMGSYIKSPINESI